MPYDHTYDEKSYVTSKAVPVQYKDPSALKQEKLNKLLQPIKQHKRSESKNKNFNETKFVNKDHDFDDKNFNINHKKVSSLKSIASVISAADKETRMR